MLVTQSMSNVMYVSNHSYGTKVRILTRQVQNVKKSSSDIVSEQYYFNFVRPTAV